VVGRACPCGVSPSKCCIVPVRHVCVTAAARASLDVSVDFRVLAPGAWHPIGSVLPPRPLRLTASALAVCSPWRDDVTVKFRRAPLVSLGSSSEFIPKRCAGAAARPERIRFSRASDPLPWGFVPFDACRSRQRPTPGFPHPAVRRPRPFSDPRRFVPPATSPAFFHAGNALGLRPSEVFPPR
jgi:hypothetical protein